MVNSCSFFLGEVMPCCKDTQTACEHPHDKGLNLLAENQRGTGSSAKNRGMSHLGVPPALVQISDDCSLGQHPNHNYMRDFEQKHPEYSLEFLTYKKA